VDIADNEVQGGNKGRVLLVDDDLELLRGCTRVLESAGLSVLPVPEGHSALREMSEGQFDVIVSDLMMPQMGGMDLVRIVRQTDLDVPILIMTAHPDIDTAVAAIDNGVLAYLRKPFDPTLFRDAVMRAVRLNRLARLKREAVKLHDGDLQQFGDRITLEAAFDRTLESLWIAFQPVVSWSRHTTLAYEALLRSREPMMATPAAVLAAAARLGRLNDLGRVTRARIAEKIAQAPAELVFVNLHAQDLVDDHLYASDCPLAEFAQRIVLELTERTALDELKGAQEGIRDLRKQGYRLAVDDLGAGYAGLSSFALIEPEVVKFDMSLIREIDSSSVKRGLVRSMTALFREMDIMVVAEGVETERERTTLVALGCDALQGYLFARPGPDFPAPRW